MSEYEYKVLTNLMLPSRELRRNPDSPMMDDNDVELALTDMQSRGWEFVGIGQKNWAAPKGTQTWWIFRRELIKEQGNGQKL